MTLVLEKGEYQLKIERDGYKSYVDILRVPAQDVVTVTLEVK